MWLRWEKLSLTQPVSQFLVILSYAELLNYFALFQKVYTGVLHNYTKISYAQLLNYFALFQKVYTGVLHNYARIQNI